jgi:predicted GNAT superfamily acetyltransferase
MDVRYGLVTALGDLEKVVDLELSVWGASAVDVIPSDLLCTVLHNGGVLLGAFCGERLVGVCLGLPGRRGKDWFMWSVMTGVHKEFQGFGIGTRLKLEQRDWCLYNDYAKVLWTFDPLQSRNAQFNIHKLQATANSYHVNYYGTMTDGINAGLPSDRLEVVWNLTKTHTQRETSANRQVLEKSMLLSSVGGRPMLGNFHDGLEQIYIEIPPDLAQLKKTDLDLALQWRLTTRKAFQTAFANHYIVTDFVEIDKRYLYVLTASQNWYMYVAECRDRTLYTGITNNVQRRISQHNAGKGAVYTAARRPITLLASWKFPDRSSAQRAEAAFKKQKRHAKLDYIRLQAAFHDGEYIVTS